MRAEVFNDILASLVAGGGEAVWDSAGAFASCENELKNASM